MDKSKNILKEHNVFPKLQLAVKNAAGVPVSTGPQKVRLLDEMVDEELDTKSRPPKMVQVVKYIFEHEGERKVYKVQVEKEGKVHYLIERLAEVEQDEEIILEMKSGPNGSYIEVKRPHKQVEDDEAATINYGEEQGDSEDPGADPNPPF